VDFRRGAINAAASLSTFAFLAAPTVASADQTSAFTSNDEGWQVAQNNVSGQIPDYQASGGNPDGYIRVTDTVADTCSNASDCSIQFFSYGAWGGNHAENYGGTFSFDLSVSGQTPDRGPQVTIAGTEGWLQTPASLATPSAAGWSHYSLTLNESGGLEYCDLITSLQCTTTPTRAQVMSVLSDMQDVTIYADVHAGTGETAGLDNVALTGGSDQDGDGVRDGVDECPAAAGLYPSGCPDSDDDGVVDPSDTCPTRAGPEPTGCPSIDRTVTISYSGKARAFKGRVLPSGPCRAHQNVTIYKKRKGPDPELAEKKTGATGRYKIASTPHQGVYYAQLKAHLEPDQGMCEPAKSHAVTVS
jgi:laminin B (domain IV)